MGTHYLLGMGVAVPAWVGLGLRGARPIQLD